VANLPSEVGYLTVVDNVVDAYSDSNDVGDVPDISQAVALVTFTPVNLRPGKPYVVVGSTGQRVHIVAIKAFLANGQLYRTADGKGPATGETPTTPGVPLVAPNQANLDWLDWHWEAEYAPAAGEPWESYTVPIYGAPGDTISIAQASMQAEFVEGLTAAKNVLAEEVTPAVPSGPLLVSDIPPQKRVGDFLIDVSKTPKILYRIGA
jgi:hypothetical protein